LERLSVFLLGSDTPRWMEFERRKRYAINPIACNIGRLAGRDAPVSSRYAQCDGLFEVYVHTRSFHAEAIPNP